MGKHTLVLGLTFVALAAFAVFAGWAFFEGSRLGGGWRSLGPIWPYVAGGVVVVARSPASSCGWPSIPRATATTTGSTRTSEPNPDGC